MKVHMNLNDWDLIMLAGKAVKQYLSHPDLQPHGAVYEFTLDNGRIVEYNVYTTRGGNISVYELG